MADSFLTHLIRSNMSMLSVLRLSSISSSSEKVATQPVTMATTWSTYKKQALDRFGVSVPSRNDCKCESMPLVSVISVRTMAACRGASLLCLVKLIRREEICAATVMIPTTPAAMDKGSDIAPTVPAIELDSAAK